MKVFIEKEPYQTFRQFIWKQGGAFLLWCFGVNISKGKYGMEIEPTYIPMFTWRNDGGIATFTLYFWGAKALSLNFMGFYPFIYIQSMEVDSLEEE